MVVSNGCVVEAAVSEGEEVCFCSCVEVDAEAVVCTDDDNEPAEEDGLGSETGVVPTVPDVSNGAVDSTISLAVFVVLKIAPRSSSQLSSSNASAPLI